MFAILLLFLSFCSKAGLPLVSQLGTKPLSKYSLSYDLTLLCKLLKFFKQNPWTKSRPGDFQFGFSWFLQVFQPFHIPIMIYQLTPYVSPEHFQFFRIWVIIILYLDSIPYKPASGYSDRSCFV